MISLAGPQIRGTIEESKDPDASGRVRAGGGAISWFGLDAVYTPLELAEMQELAGLVRAGTAERSELELLHTIHALLDPTEVEYRPGPVMTDEQANAYVARWNAPETQEAPRRERRGAVGADQGSVFG